MASKSANIFDIKRYSINDGPGIRTTIFFKGCPLKCWWCHNPESQNTNPEETNGCISRWKTSYEEKGNKIGRIVSIEYIMKEIEKDLPFYEESKGGVTFSGGEPMIQIDFLYELLEQCNRKEIHTAIDTTGFVDFKDFEKIYDLTSLFLYDLKLMDDGLHQKYTGVSNNVIHENLRKLSGAGNKVILRIPIIPTITNTEKNISEMISFISQLKNVKEIHLLPFHKAAGSKYEKMNWENKLNHLETPSVDEMNILKEKFSNINPNVKVGG